MPTRREGEKETRFEDLRLRQSRPAQRGEVKREAVGKLVVESTNGAL
jgi:hypothetical protein